MEEEVDRIEEDEEMAWIYEDAKDKHQKIMTGWFKLNKYCTVTIHVTKTSMIQCMQCNALNGTDVEDIKIHVLFVICSYSYSSQRLQTRGRGLGQVREGVSGGGCRGAAPTAPVCEDTYHTHPNSNPNDIG